VEWEFVFGHGMSDFAAGGRTLVDGGAAQRVTDPDALTTQVEQVLRDGDVREKMSKAATAVADAKRGVLDRTMALLAPYFEGDLHARA